MERWYAKLILRLKNSVGNILMSDVAKRECLYMPDFMVWPWKGGAVTKFQGFEKMITGNESGFMSVRIPDSESQGFLLY